MPDAFDMAACPSNKNTGSSAVWQPQDEIAIKVLIAAEQIRESNLFIAVFPHFVFIPMIVLQK